MPETKQPATPDDLDRHAEATARVRAIRVHLTAVGGDPNYTAMALDVIKYLDSIRPRLGLG